MSGQRINIDLDPVQKTLLLPLWARAREAYKENPIIDDKYAGDIIGNINFDFSNIESEFAELEQLNWVIRAYNFDNIVQTFIKDKESAVINLGAGLDTGFQRVDNGNVLWVNVDLPDVSALRQKLIPDSEREITVAKSLFDFTWIDDIARYTKGRSVMLISAGVLFYFPASEVESLFRKLSVVYPSAHFVFDTMPWLLVWAANLEIRRRKLENTIPLFGWYLNKASRLRKWVNKLQVIEEYPMYSRIQFRDDWSKTTRRNMKIMNFFRWYNINHVQI